MEREHVDLEEPFRYSIDVEFEFSKLVFENLQPLEIEIKKKVEQKIVVQNVELRNNSKRALF